ncbi:MAG: GrpB family protein [Cyanobacteria bacterium P01_H01_bin.58]
MVREVKVVPHNPDWKNQFEAEQQYIQAAMGNNAIAIHHIGSTSILQIHAKPIIDILAEVADIYRVDTQTSNLEDLGYEAMGEYGIPGRRYFRKWDAVGNRTHHLHVFQTASPDVERHLHFRDYLIAHPAEAEVYSQLKQHLAALHPYDIEAYMDGKDGFIQAVEQKAQQWHQASFSKPSF